MRAKKHLKSKPGLQDIYISDDLTRLRRKIVNHMRNDPRISKVWTIDGKISCVLKEDGKERKIMLDYLTDVSKLGWSNEEMKDLELYLEL